MALSASQKKVLRIEIGDLIVRGCSATGLIAGLLWPLDHPNRTTPQACAAPGPETLDTCLNDTLIASILPYALAMTAGLTGGAIVEKVLALGLVRTPAGERRRPSPVGLHRRRQEIPR